MTRLTRTHSGLLLAAVSLFLLFASSAFAQSQSTARIVRLSYVNGDVQMDRGQGLGLDRALLNLPVIQGSRIVTARGEAEVELEDGSTVRVAPSSDVSFPVLALRSGGTESVVAIHQGTAFIDFFHRDGAEMSVLLGPRTALQLRRSTRFRVEVDNYTARLAVYRGSLEYAGVQRNVDARRGETLSIELGDPAHYVLARYIQPGPYDDWDEARAKQREQYASAHRGGYSHEVTDLSMYGGYTYVASYGYLWRPWGVALGWDPWGSGAWVWYPTFGYTWVSAHPWGWLPYNCGSWVWINNYGWGWRPGSWSVNFVNFGRPNWRNHPPGWVAPAPPPHPHPGPVPVGIAGGSRPGLSGDHDRPGGFNGGHHGPIAGNGAGPDHGGSGAPAGSGGTQFSGAAGTDANATASVRPPTRPGIVFVGDGDKLMDPLGNHEGGRGSMGPRQRNDDALSRFGNRGGGGTVTVVGSGSANGSLTRDGEGNVTVVPSGNVGRGNWRDREGTRPGASGSGSGEAAVGFSQQPAPAPAVATPPASAYVPPTASPTTGSTSNGTLSGTPGYRPATPMYEGGRGRVRPDPPENGYRPAMPAGAPSGDAGRGRMRPEPAESSYRPAMPSGSAGGERFSSRPAAPAPSPSPAPMSAPSGSMGGHSGGGGESRPSPPASVHMGGGDRPAHSGGGERSGGPARPREQ
jgi:hypothetical protein